MKLGVTHVGIVQDSGINNHIVDLLQHSKGRKLLDECLLGIRHGTTLKGNRADAYQLVRGNITKKQTTGAHRSRTCHLPELICMVWIPRRCNDLIPTFEQLPHELETDASTGPDDKPGGRSGSRARLGHGIDEVCYSSHVHDKVMES